MKSIQYFAILCLAITATSQPLSSLDSAQYFDFWVGEWTASWDEGNGVEELGTNSISKTLDNRVITEQFRIMKGQNAGFKGTSNSLFQPATNTWKQAWADNQGGYFDFTGDFDGEKRMFKTSPRISGTNTIVQRMVFYELTEDTMTWDWEISQDGGKTWNLSWRIFYKRS